VGIRIITNRSKKNTSIGAQLESLGVHVRYAPGPLAYAFAVIDGPTPKDPQGTRSRVIGSATGFAAGGLHNPLPYIMVTPTGFPLALNYQKEFNQVWDRSRDHGDHTLDSAIDVIPDSAYRVGFSGGRRQSGASDLVKPILKQIAGAAKSIQIAAGTFERGDLYLALKQAMGRGVKVEIVLPSEQFQTRKETRPSTQCEAPLMKGRHFDECLAEAGALVTYVLIPRKNKATNLTGHLILIDKNLGFAGSLELSLDQDSKTFSHSQLIEGLSAHNATKQFVALRHMRSELVPGLITRITKRRGYGPCQFQSMSLEATDLARLQQLYRPGACR
jgi:hypothetical protein